MSSQSTPQTVKQNLTERQLSALKVIKYLFISSLILLIIGSIVLFFTAINSIVDNSENIDTIERFGVTELALKRSEQFKQQRLSAIFSLIIHLLIILWSCFGFLSIIKDNFLLLIIFAIFNTIILITSLLSTTSKAAIILLQIAVSLFAFCYTLIIYYEMRVELKKKKKKKNIKRVNNSTKNNGFIENNGKNVHHFEEQMVDIQNNNPDFDDIKDLKNLDGIIV